MLIFWLIVFLLLSPAMFGFALMIYGYVWSNKQLKKNKDDLKIQNKEPNKAISPWYILHYKFNDMGITYIFHNISVCFVDNKKPNINKVKNYACENQDVNIVISSDDPADINAVEVYTTNNIYLGYIDGEDYSWAETGFYRERLKYLLHDYIKRGFPVKAGIVKAEENDIRLNIGLYTPETEREFKEEKTFSLFSTTTKMQNNLYNYASENDEVIFNYDDEKERWVFYLEDYSCNNELEIGFAPKDQLYLLKELSEFSIQYYAEITKIKESESGKYQVEVILKYY